MHHIPEPHDAAELSKVGFAGLLGFFATTQLSDWNSIVSLMLGLASLGYVVSKGVFMVIDRKERKRRERTFDRYDLD